MKKDLVIINNEKCIKKEDSFYCENIEIKSITELLSKAFNIKLILRKSAVNPIHQIENSEVIASSNIFDFTKNIIILKLIIPLVIVNTLKGNGVKPARNNVPNQKITPPLLDILF